MQRGPIIFVVIDRSNSVFGGFLSCDFKCADEYYATAESFLFMFKDGDVKENFRKEKI